MATTVVVALLRGVNLGKRRMKMEALRVMCEEQGHTNVQTYVQSGNVVFRTRAKCGPALARKLEAAIGETFGFHAPVVLRTAEEMRAVVAANPFAKEAAADPKRLQVNFLSGDLVGSAREATLALHAGVPEQTLLVGRELFTYYPHGVAASSLPFAKIERAMAGVLGTARNWNSVLALTEMANR